MARRQNSARAERRERERSAAAHERVTARTVASTSDGPRFDVQRAMLYCAVLVALTAILYGSVTSHPFVNYDDEGYVSKNAHVRDGLSLQTMEWAIASTEMANWHPVTWLSHALDYQFFGDWAGGHHLTNLVLHIANVVALYLLLARVTGAAECSFWVALLFAVHPLNVESVAWVAERKNVLSTLFFFLTLGAYGWYARKASVQRYLTMAALFALGLAAKPMLVTLPFVLLLLDYWPLQRMQGWAEPSVAFPVPQLPWPRLVIEKVPLLMLSAASSVITVIAQASRALATEAQVPLAVRLENAIYSYGKYIAMMFWPADLAPIYPHPGTNLAGWLVGIELVFLVAVTALAWHFRRAYPYLVIGWLWYLGTLVPVIGIVQVGAQGWADRYVYVPLVGVFVMLVWGASELAQSRRVLMPLRVAFICAAAALCVLTVKQLRYWKSPYDLWAHTLEVTSNNYIAEDNMAVALLRQGSIEALTHFQNASRIAPNDPVSQGAIASYLQDQGRFQEAIAHYQIAVRGNRDPELLALAEGNLAILYRQVGQYEQARETWRKAAATDPAVTEEMRQSLMRRLSAQPDGAGFLRLGLLYDVAGDVTQARAAYQRALQMDPNSSDTKRYLDTLR